MVSKCFPQMFLDVFGVHGSKMFQVICFLKSDWTDRCAEGLGLRGAGLGGHLCYTLCGAATGHDHLEIMVIARKLGLKLRYSSIAPCHPYVFAVLRGDYSMTHDNDVGQLKPPRRVHWASIGGLRAPLGAELHVDDATGVAIRRCLEGGCWARFSWGWKMFWGFWGWCNH
jgi:hypothetical protein